MRIIDADKKKWKGQDALVDMIEHIDEHYIMVDGATLTSPSYSIGDPLDAKSIKPKE